MKNKKKKVKGLRLEKHVLIPVHKKLIETEKKKVLEMYNITFRELPNILVDDPSIQHLDVKEGDVIKIIRKSPTSGEFVFYRGVVNS